MKGLPSFFTAGICAAYHFKALKRLLHVYIEQTMKGLPSFFTTGSCAAYHFKALKRLLHVYIEQTTGSRTDLNDRNVLFKSMQKSTHIDAHYFDIRQNHILKMLRVQYLV